jgi:hypothetical protein
MPVIKNTSPKYGRGKNPNSHKHGLFRIGHKTNVGRPCSIQTRIKISKRNKGKGRGAGWKHNTTTIQKLREQKLGENNPQWKGGITSLYKQIFRHIKYRQWRSDVFQRDEYTCQKCNVKKLKIFAHHIKAFALIIRENMIITLEQALSCEELWNINNGETLCGDCHKETETYGKHN